MMEKFRLVAVSLCSAILFAACGSELRPEAQDYSTKIIGGEFATEQSRERLATVALLSRGSAFCSGTLISPQFVVTAAHCLSSSRFDVGFGLGIPSLVQVPAEDIFLQPDGFDIALVKLSRPAPSWTVPVEILADDVELVSGSALILAGFGSTSPRIGSGGGTLKVVETILDQVAVEQKEIWFGPTPGRSACRGDSGGPAYVDVEGSLYLLGSTIGGFRLPACSGSGRYSDVRAHREWIASLVN